MAYLQPQDEEDQQQQAPAQPLAPGAGSGGGGMIGGGGSKGGGFVPQQQTPQQQQGTSFTNLKGWLDAGQGRDQTITNTGQSLLGKEKSAFDEAAKPVEDADYHAKTLTVDEAKAGLSKPGDLGVLRSALRNDYDGPREINYNGQEGLGKLGQLGSASGAAGMLGGGTAGYGGGRRRMDEVLFSSDAASQNAMKGVTGDTQAFKDQALARGKAAQAKVAGFDKSAQDANTANVATLRGVGDQTLAGIDQRIDDLKAKEAKTKASAPHAFDGSTPGQSWVNGSGFNRQNVTTDDEVGLLANLRSLIDDPKYNLTKNGQYNEGFWNRDPTSVSEDRTERPDPWGGVHWDPNSTSTQWDGALMGGNTSQEIADRMKTPGRWVNAAGEVVDSPAQYSEQWDAYIYPDGTMVPAGLKTNAGENFFVANNMDTQQQLDYQKARLGVDPQTGKMFVKDKSTGVPWMQNLLSALKGGK